jgi:hypothetical protein
VIDLTETMFLLSDGARQPGIGKSYSSLYRYARHGVRRGDQVTRLESIRTPTGLATSLEAYQRFIEKLNETKP